MNPKPDGKPKSAPKREDSPPCDWWRDIGSEYYPRGWWVTFGATPTPWKETKWMDLPQWLRRELCQIHDEKIGAIPFAA